MYRNIAEMVEIYTMEVIEFDGWVNGIRERYGNDLSVARIGEVNFEKLVERVLKLEGMQKVLGLNEDEIKAIDKKIGADEASRGFVPREQQKLH